MQIRIFCSIATSPPLASYAALLTYGRHEKFVSDCVNLPCSEETLIMTGVVAALESLKRPSEVIVTTSIDALREAYHRTALDLRGRADALEKIHRICYVYAGQESSFDMKRCRAAAEDIILRYRRACVIAAHAKQVLASAFECFEVPKNERVEVSEPGESDGEEVAWNQGVMISLADLYTDGTV